MSGPIKSLVEKERVIAIIRGLYGTPLLRLAAALSQGGIRLLEVTFDQSDPACIKKTPEAIGALREAYGETMFFGAGTVLSAAQAEEAAEAGAEFIISPDTNPEVIQKTKDLGLISIPAGMTPTEILNAHNLGADYVKIFPAARLGLSWLKDVRGPINHVKLIAVGGIGEENLAAFLKGGCTAVGIGGAITDKALIAAGRFEELSRRAAAFKKIAEAI